MKYRVLPLACVVLPLLSVSGHARSSDCNVAIGKWQPRQAIRAFAKSNNWVLRRIKIDDGCYEIYAWDQNGDAVEVELMPDTLEIIKIEREHVDREEPEKQEDNADD